MDDCGFDDVARQAGRVSTRRSAVAVAAAELVVFGFGRQAAGACQSQGAFCKKPKNCCTEVCTKLPGSKKKKCWCKQLGEACKTAANCCSIPSMDCDTTIGKKKRCCLPAGSPCNIDDDCCGREASCDAGTCADNRCTPEGGDCTDDGECCADLACVEDTCLI